MGIEIDKVDSKIICLLQKNGRMPNTEIAQKLGISEATIRKRIQRLISDGVIKIVAACDPFKLEFNVVGNMRIKLDIKKSEQAIEELRQLDELWYISLVSGPYDLDIEFRLTSIDELHSLLYDRIYPIEGVLSSESSFTLKHIMDLCSRQIVGWSMDKRMKKELALDALAMAYWRRKPLPGLIHHSDRGVQYACCEYQKRIKQFKMKASMSRKGNCWDNAPTERFFRSLKSERLSDCRFVTRSAAVYEALDYITYYNSLRLHSSLGYKTPLAYEKERYLNVA